MQAMFSDDFIESSARVVKFPGVSRFVCQKTERFLCVEFLFILVLHFKRFYTSFTQTGNHVSQLLTA